MRTDHLPVGGSERLEDLQVQVMRRIQAKGHTVGLLIGLGNGTTAILLSRLPYLTQNRHCHLKINPSPWARLLTEKA